MKKIMVTILIILFCISAIGGLIFLMSKSNRDSNNSNNTIKEAKDIKVINNVNEMNTNNNKIESENKLISEIKVVINGKTYNAKIEENETAQNFISMLPLEYKMSELNNNEKYVYLESTLPTDSYNPEFIEAGDIMLYENNCLVIFYKSFNTPYSYTKIGHIEDLPDLGNENITINFEK